jgi:predicted transcriptional regulator
MALAEARGKATLRSVLLVLAQEGRANLSRTGAQLKRAPGEVHSCLKRLADINLVGRESRRYSITDPIIALWIKFTILVSICCTCTPGIDV